MLYVVHVTADITDVASDEFIFGPFASESMASEAIKKLGPIANEKLAQALLVIRELRSVDETVSENAFT